MTYLPLKALSSLLMLALATSSFATDITYSEDIAPLWQQKCAACHDATAPYYGDFKKDKAKYKNLMKGPRMDTYADLLFFIGWPDTGALMRRLDDGANNKDGKPGNMYTYLGSNDEERAANFLLFKKWVGMDAWNLNRWKERNGVPGISKEQMSNIKAKY